MTAQEENDLLTQTGRGTPCGELMRRYWQPAALSEELAPGNPPPLPAYEVFAKPLERSALTKVLRDENYLQGIVDANESPLSDASFILPNLVVSPVSPSGAESWVRWHVPVDDNSHVAFTLRHSGESQFTGEPRASLHHVLFQAIETIRAAPRAPSASAEKE